MLANRSLWHKAWIETRWRFLIGLVLLVCSAGAVVFAYPSLMKLLPLAGAVPASGALGRQIKESIDLQRTYGGYVWAQWFRQNLAQIWTIFAVLLGTGGIVSHSSGGAALFTLSMPVSRERLMGVRAAAGFAELLVLAFVPSLTITLLSPAVGETYGLGSVLVHSACMFLAGTAFFSLAFLLSTLFGDIWRPIVIALAVAMVIGACGQVFPDLSRYGIFGVMSGESWFRDGNLPWLGLFVCIAASAAMLLGATRNIARRDF